jgi:flagellin-like protein
MASRTGGNQGLMGIGTLIIFIAIILVAAVAAGVLITTGGSLQQKALITGSQSEEGVSTGFDIVTITGEDASSTGTPHNIQYVTILTRLHAGSVPIGFNQTVVMVDTESTSQSINYNTTVGEGSLSSSTAYYLIHYVKEGSNHEDGYLQRGDVAQILLMTSNPIGENEPVRIHIIPRIGITSEIQFITSNTMTQRKVFLWPT